MKTKMVVLAGLLAAAVPAAFAADAKTNWEDHCARCHGATGKADSKMGQKLKLRDYSDPKVQAAFTDEQLLEATMKGVIVDGKEKMKGYADKLSADEGKELVKLIRSFKS
ncbi:cytochrome c [Opitutus sp. ER46]|uniref:c-type cytochrome n=1 Tax=Opitutus sp. ER46 TaxID=2161864 RepID=UPI000D303D32|nr:cytochrome c [Opitutus sp. ER46]PTX94566.1 cytochrome C [Opitutus sp. ER46]